MPGWIGPWELAILLVVVLLVFGPKRLPEMGRSLGKGMREFKSSVTGKEHRDDDDSATELTAIATEEDISVAAATAPKHERDAL